MANEIDLLQDLKTGRATAAADSAEVKRLRWLSIVCALGMATAVGCCRGWGTEVFPELDDGKIDSKPPFFVHKYGFLYVLP